MDMNKEFIVSYVKQELGKDIPTKTSKKFKIGDKVLVEDLVAFSADNAMILEYVTAKGINKIRVSILDHKRIPHLTGLEINQ